MSVVPEPDGPCPLPPTAERIVAELRAEILSGRYRAGDRLPSERELAERFKTHRGAVREALKKLEQLGVADIRPGGARAAPLEEASLDIVQHLLELESPPNPVLFDQVFEVFGGLFSLSARLGAERASPAQRARAAEIIDTLMTEGLPLADEHQLIMSLSELFVEASGNPILSLVRKGLSTGVLERLENRETLLRPPDAERRPLLERVARSFAEGDGPGASNALYLLSQAVRRNAVELLEKERARLGVTRPADATYPSDRMEPAHPTDARGAARTSAPSPADSTRPVPDADPGAAPEPARAKRRKKRTQR